MPKVPKVKNRFYLYFILDILGIFNFSHFSKVQR
jgi:hypothetical protein